MKVLHVINTLSAGGAELHLLTLCRQLKRRGVEIVVACLKEQIGGCRLLRPNFEKEGIRVICLGAERNFDPRCVFRYIRLLRLERPVLVHTHLPRADFVGACGRRLYPFARWICTVHDIYSAQWSGKWALSLFDLIWRRADALIAISHGVKTWLERDRRIPPDKVMVVHYGIEFDRFIGLNAGSGGSQGLNGGRTIASVGRLEPRKGHETLIRAMPAILQQVPNGSLLIAGHDIWGYGPKLQGLIDELNLNGQVRLVGFQHDVPLFLRSSDVFALASKAEGFGQVVIEAMAAGKPVVASRIAPLTEIVVDKETGLLVEAGNPDAFASAIVRLLTDPQLAKHMGAQGQIRVKEVFGVSAMAERTLALYQQCLAGGIGR